NLGASRRWAVTPGWSHGLGWKDPRKAWCEPSSRPGRARAGVSGSWHGRENGVVVILVSAAYATSAGGVCPVRVIDGSIAPHARSLPLRAGDVRHGVQRVRNGAPRHDGGVGLGQRISVGLCQTSPLHGLGGGPVVRHNATDRVELLSALWSK